MLERTTWNNIEQEISGNRVLVGVLLLAGPAGPAGPKEDT